MTNKQNTLTLTGIGFNLLAKWVAAENDFLNARWASAQHTPKDPKSRDRMNAERILRETNDEANNLRRAIFEAAGEKLVTLSIDPVTRNLTITTK
jgi:hypothetical protein